MDWIRSTYYNIKYGIKNIVKWFPIIWRNREWDHYFIFELLKFKLEKMEEYFKKYGHSIYSEKDADEIHKCVLLLDRIIKDDYWNNISKKYYEKWGEIKYNKMDENWFKLELENVKTKEDEKQHIKELKILCKKENILRKQDLELLFNIMNKKILNWWD